MSHAYRVASQIEEGTDCFSILADKFCTIKSMVYRTVCLTTVSVYVCSTLGNLKMEILIRLLFCNRLYGIGNDCLNGSLLIGSIGSTRLSACSTETRRTVSMDIVKKDIVVRKTGTAADLCTDFTSKRRRYLHHVIGNKTYLLLAVSNGKGMCPERNMNTVRQAVTGSKTRKHYMFIFQCGNVSRSEITFERCF